MYSKIIKKQKKSLAPDAKELIVGKETSEHALKSLAPKMENEDEDEDEMRKSPVAQQMGKVRKLREEQEQGNLSDVDKQRMGKSATPETKIEIELMIQGAKKKKK